jgi:ABC-type amino acid transport substrate-binding protein
MSKRFRREVKIHSVAVKPKNRMAMIATDIVDVEMGSLSSTKTGEDVMDFNLIFFVSETTFMAPATLKLRTLSDLNRKRIGCAAGTTNY